jgi:hypothetical protein
MVWGHFTAIFLWMLLAQKKKALPYAAGPSFLFDYLGAL